MAFEYEKNSVKKASEFLAVFLLSAGFGIVIPIIFAVGAVVACREGVQNKIRPRHGNAAAYPRRSGLAAFFQELVTQPFLKLAH